MTLLPLLHNSSASQLNAHLATACLLMLWCVLLEMAGSSPAATRKKLDFSSKKCKTLLPYTMLLW